MSDTIQTETSHTEESNVIYASITKRVIAFVIDLLLFWGVLLLVALPIDYIDLELRSARGSTTNQVSSWIVGAIVIAILWAYHVFLENSKLQGTLGKVVVGIKVLTNEENKVSILQSSIRVFVKFGFLMVLAIIPAIFSQFKLIILANALFWWWLINSVKKHPQKKAFHDIVVGTVVVAK